jgi:hypothetical protein
MVEVDDFAISKHLLHGVGWLGAANNEKGDTSTGEHDDVN